MGTMVRIIISTMIFGLTFDVGFDINTLMDLLNKIDQNAYAGMLVIGDVHGEYDAFHRAVMYAKSNGLFILSLGDLMDHGEGSYECVALMDTLLKSGDAALVIGNHEQKYVRFAKRRQQIKANAVERERLGDPNWRKKQEERDGMTPSPMHLHTMLYVGDEREDEFFQLIIDLVNHPMSDDQIFYGNVIFSHGGVHAASWDAAADIGNQRSRMKIKSTAMYGETDGVTRDDDGFPVRTYTWTDEVPAGKHAVVGHDAGAMGKKKGRTHSYQNANGGNTTFLDTHSGKGGILSGGVFNFSPEGLDFSVFVSF